jgi:twitching motility protein PilT
MEFVQRHRALPLSVEGKTLTVGLVDEPSSAVLGAIRQQVPAMDVRTLHIEPAFFNEVLQTSSGSGAWRLRTPTVAAGKPHKSSPALDELLQRVVAEGASDLHLSAGHKPRWRIDGLMAEISDAAVLGPEDVKELLTPVMDSRHLKEYERDNDVDLGYEVPGLARFRVNVFRDHHGSGAVLRQIPSTVMTFEQLGLPPVLKSFCEIPKGLVLVTGPTGSGKSTTLAAMIDSINRVRKDHIITLEDPIEFVHQSRQCLVNQREVGGHTTSFARALKACLREDPDIVLVGEMRDLETIALALETANTGHLVFATLHTNTAISSIDRIIDQFPGDQQAQVRSVLSDVLRGVVSQTLCRKIGGGRIAALEVLVVNMAAQNLIREHKTVQITSVMQANKAAGNALLNDTLAQLVEEKKVELAEALSKSSDKEDLAKRFRSGIKLFEDQGQIKVISVQPSSAGHEAGFQRGDVLLDVDTRPIKELSLEEAKQILRVETKHPITVDRAGKRVKLVLDLTKKGGIYS